MVFNKPFIHFHNDEEKISFLRKYGLLSPKATGLKPLYYKGREVSSPVECAVLGYEREYENYATLVIDFGSGTFFIHSSFLKQMQAKNFSLDSAEE